MKIVIVYDSYFGNTEKIAAVMAHDLKSNHQVYLARIDELTPERLVGADLMVIGSPTRGFRPTPKITEFITDQVPTYDFGAIAIFDTRADVKEIKNRFLTFLMSRAGYANDAMVKSLKKAHQPLVGEPGEFYVTGKEGPLESDEETKAVAWIQEIVASLSN